MPLIDHSLQFGKKQRYIVNDDGCWIWQMSRTGTNKEYGSAPSGGTNKGRARVAHRWVYEHFFGPLGEGIHLHHRPTCSKLCVNPDHLTPVTHADHNTIHFKGKKHSPEFVAKRIAGMRRFYGSVAN